MFATYTKRLPWTLFFFIPILYFTLFDQPGFVPSARTFSIYLVLLVFVPWLGLKVWCRQSFVYTPLDYPFLLIIAVHLISVFLSAASRLTFYSLWLLLLSILTFYILLDQLQAGRENVLWKAVFLVAAIVLELAVLEFLAWYFGLFPLLEFDISWPKVAGWTFPPVPRRLGLALLTVPVAPPFSGYVAMFIPVTLGLALSTRRRSVRLGLAGFGLLALVILILTFSRTGLVALGLGLATFAGLSGYVWKRVGFGSDGSTHLRLWNWSQPHSKYLALGLLFVFALLFIEVFLNRDSIFFNRQSSNEHRLFLLQAAWRMWQDQPWFGVGPGLFGLFYKNYIPPNMLYFISISAHSVYFQTLAEIGLVGLLAVTLLPVIGLREGYEKLRYAASSQKVWRLIGVISSLVAFLTAAAIEEVWFLAFIIPFCFLAAYLFYFPSGRAALPSMSRSRRIRAWLPGFYLVILVGFAATLLHTNRVAEQFFMVTASAEPGQELATAEAMRHLQQADPGLPLYTLGQAYFQGKQVITKLQVEPCILPPARLPETERAVLAEAIRAYETGLHVIKSHPIYWANLAALYWLDRQPEAAQAALKQAVELSDLNDPKTAFYLLNSGCYYELQGETEPAIAAYGQLLAHTPDIISSPFWQASEFRAAHLSAIIESAVQQPPTAPEQLAVAIRIELARGNEQAADVLVDKLAVTFPDDYNGLKWHAQQLIRQQKYPESQAIADRFEDDQLRGEIALAKGDFTAAQTYLEKAVFLNLDDTEAYYDLAQVALAEGDSAAAIGYLKRITPPFSPPTTTEARFIYGYPPDFSIYPSLLLIAPPPLQGQPFRLLARLYRQSGQADLANEIERALASYDPYLKNE